MKYLLAISLILLAGCAPLKRKIMRGSFEDWQTYSIETNLNPLSRLPEDFKVYIEYDPYSIAQVLQLNFSLIEALKNNNINVVNNKSEANIISKISIEDESESKSAAIPNISTSNTFGNINGKNFNSTTIGTNGITVYNWVNKKYKVVIYAFDTEGKIYWIGVFKDDGDDIIKYRRDYMLAITHFFGKTFIGDVDIGEKSHEIFKVKSN